jgi:hypothetical protein
MMMPRKTRKPSAEKTVHDIRRATRRRYSAEEKIRFDDVQAPLLSRRQSDNFQYSSAVSCGVTCYM